MGRDSVDGLRGLMWWMWWANLVVFACVLGAALLVDGNGRLPCLKETPSLVASIGMMTLGGLLTTLVLILDPQKTRKCVAVVMFVMYIIWAIPVLM
jgi:hypothetical protein